MRRVVVTGIGLVTPLGIGTDNNWRRLLAGESGLRAIQSFDVSDLPAKIAGQVPRGSTEAGLFNTDDWVPPKDQKKMDLFIVYAIGAAVMVCCGAEAAICRLGMAGFAASRALSTNFNDTPSRASRPWDKDRDGFVMGEGAGIVVIEEYEHAKKRGAKIYAELIGYGM